jgi:hypothetical protein
MEAQRDHNSQKLAQLGDRTLRLEPKSELGVVAHICNSRYSDGEDWKDHRSRPARQKVSKTPYQQNQLDIVARSCNSSSLHSRLTWAKIRAPIWKIPKAKKKKKRKKEKQKTKPTWVYPQSTLLKQP